MHVTGIGFKIKFIFELALHFLNLLNIMYVMIYFVISSTVYMICHILRNI